MPCKIRIERAHGREHLVVDGWNGELFDKLVDRYYFTFRDDGYHAIEVTADDYEKVKTAVECYGVQIDESVMEWLTVNEKAHNELLRLANAERERQKAEEEREERRKRYEWHDKHSCNHCNHLNAVADDYFCDHCNKLIDRDGPGGYMTASAGFGDSLTVLVHSILPLPYPIDGCAWKE